MEGIIYCRVSSQRQVNEGHGLDSQEKRCQDYARSMGYQVIAVFREEGESGGLFERTAMKQLLAFLEKQGVISEKRIVVIFDDLKRFARDVEIHFKLKKEIYGRNGRIESPNFKFEDTPEGKFVETMMAATAALERDQNTRQVKQKMKARLEGGYWPFMLPFGLINQKDPIHGKIAVPREPYATIYKEGIKKYRDGILPTILDFQSFVNKKYKELGIKRKMSNSTAKHTLKEILYAGYIEYPKWGVARMKAKHEGFISLETYERVRERLEGREKPWHRKDYRLDFPLRPLVMCSNCNTPMTASYHTGRNGDRNPHYYCRRSKKECIYGNRNIQKKIFESQFEALLSDVKPFDELVDLTKEILREQWGIRYKQYVTARKRTIAEVDEAEVAIKSYLKRIQKTTDEDLISLYEEEIKKLKREKNKREQKIQKQHYTAEQFGTVSEKVFNTLKNPMSMWKSDEYDDKRTILFMYFEGELRYDYKLGFGTAGLAYPVKLINEIGQAQNAGVEMSGNEPESE